ncbi:MAG: hydrogenase maturation protease [Dehalococcoidia bacterium]|nr:hydrogenase maturation protease [Dehalococcoidia bacterium]
MKTLVLGLGNPLLSDDGVGLRVVAALKGRLIDRDVTVTETSMAGLNLLDILEGQEKAIVVDAIQTEGGEPGQIYRLDPGAFESTLHASSAHDVNFATALELGKRLGLALPKQIVIFGIEAADTSTVSEECTPAVEAAIPLCAQMIVREVGEGDTCIV